MTDNSTVQDLVAAISEGRACLLLGQDHTEGLVGSVTTEASSLASTPVASLREALSAVDAATLTASMAEYLATRHVPLIEIASLPWSSVVSTAVDLGFLDALAAASTTRRLVNFSTPKRRSTEPKGIRNMRPRIRLDLDEGCIALTKPLLKTNHPRRASRVAGPPGLRGRFERREGA